MFMNNHDNWHFDIQCKKAFHASFGNQLFLLYLAIIPTIRSYYTDLYVCT